MDCMKIYEVTSTNTPVTNMTQLFLRYYPYDHHQRLSRFGENAGFKISLIEKYTFFWPHLTNSSLYGEVICMSARPFPGTDNHKYRIYISKTGPHAYTYTPIWEERAQAILQEAKPSVAALPLLEAPPPPPPELKPLLDRSLGSRYEEFVWNLSGALGQDSSMPVRILLKVVAVVVISALTLFCVFFIRRRGRAQG
jgi:hypothetical protein